MTASVLSLAMLLPVVVSVVSRSGAAEGATLTVLEGSVAIAFAANTSPQVREAVDGETLAPGDIVHMGADGRAVVTFFDGAETVLAPGTQLRLEQPTLSDAGSSRIIRALKALEVTMHGGSRNDVQRSFAPTAVGFARAG